jgi:hypothetical protein
VTDADEHPWWEALACIALFFPGLFVLAVEALWGEP